MKSLKELNLFFLPLLIVGVGMFAIACSSDDHEESKEDEVIIDNDPPQIVDGFSVSLQLLNKDSVAVKSFTEGENIIFRLVITNKRDSTVSLRYLPEILGDDAFTVYNKENVKIDKPWDVKAEWGGLRPRLHTDDSLTIEVPWIGGTAKTTVLFISWGNKTPLSKGSYYSQFDICIDSYSDKKVSCRKDFVVK